MFEFIMTFKVVFPCSFKVEYFTCKDNSLMNPFYVSVQIISPAKSFMTIITFKTVSPMDPLNMSF